MCNANKDVVINNNTPHTPRKRGAEIASVENYSLALDLWRTTCAEAGLAFIVDNCTANGARKVAARYLDTGALTPEAVKRAMQKLAHLITHNERANHYTLNALGNNTSRYIETPKKTATAAAQKRVVWDFICDKCGATAAGFLPGSRTAGFHPVRPSELQRHDDCEKRMKENAMNNNENTIAITLGTSQTSAQPTAISLGNYADGDLITKKELGKCLGCSERTLQRMVERFELPPPMPLAGRKVWVVGKLRAWFTEAAERREAEALKEARRLRVFE